MIIWNTMKSIPEVWWWITGLNAAVTLCMIVWFWRQTGDGRHRALLTVYGVIWGILTGFFTPMLALDVQRRAGARRQNVLFWFILVSLTSIFGWLTYRAVDDLESRQTSAGPRAAIGALTLLFSASIVALSATWGSLMTGYLFASRQSARPPFPWWPPAALVLSVGFFILMKVLRPKLTVAMVKDRLERLGQLQPTGPDELVVVRGLVKYFPVRKGAFGTTGAVVKAVDDVSFTLKKGQTLGLVGESGCGKTTVGRLLLRLLERTRGTVLFDGMDLTLLSPGELRAVRGRMQLVFQDPFGSLNPRMTVGSIVGEALGIHGVARGEDRRRKVTELLVRVGLSADHLRRYPHEFSGGQRQRIGIARALALNPSFIVCDEPVSALDVSIQAQILNLLADLQREFGLTYLFIAHDLSVVEHISDDVAVMYLGKIVEKAPSVELYRSPLHPYTTALLSAIPIPDPTARRERIVLQGDVPTPINPPAGCSFHPRCRYAVPECREAIPILRELAPGHLAACIRAEAIRNDPEATVTGGIEAMVRDETGALVRPATPS